MSEKSSIRTEEMVSVYCVYCDPDGSKQLEPFMEVERVETEAISESGICDSCWENTVEPALSECRDCVFNWNLKIRFDHPIRSQFGFPAHLDSECGSRRCWGRKKLEEGQG